MAVNADNALIFSSDNDALWLGEYEVDFGNKITSLTQDLSGVTTLTNVGCCLLYTSCPSLPACGKPCG